MSRAMLLAVALGGCSWVFQEKLPSNWDGNSEPRCSDSKGLAVLDGLLFASDAVAVIAASASDGVVSSADRQDFVISSAIEGFVFGLSALAGSHWADECTDARAQWADSEAEQRKHDQLVGERRNVDEARGQRASAVVEPRGFYCFAAGSSGFCARERTDCDAERSFRFSSDTANNVDDCRLHETAWCYTARRCLPTQEMCTTERARLTGAGFGDCKEQR